MIMCCLETHNLLKGDISLEWQRISTKVDIPFCFDETLQFMRRK